MAFDPAAFAKQLKLMEDAGTTTKQLRTQLSDLSAQNLADLKAEAAAFEEVTNALNVEGAARQLRNQSLEAQVAIQEAAIDAMAEGQVKDEAQIGLNETLIAQEKEKIKLGISSGDVGQQRIEQLQQENKDLQENIDLTKESAASIGTLTASFSKLFSGSAPPASSLFSPTAMLKVVKGLKNAGAGAESLAKAFSKAPAAALKAYGDAIVKLTIELGDLENEFRRATGADAAFARSITNSYAQMREYTIGAKELNATNTALYTSFTNFTFASEEQRTSLAESGAVLQKLGVSHGDFANSIQLSTKALGMSTEEAGQNMLDLEKFARNLGVAPQEMARDFAGAGDMMAKMGDQGTRAFKELQAVMKVTGMDMQKILRLTDQFDTFEGAAEQAGKLNAALGGNFVNAMDLMTATEPAERFGMIRDSILDAGLSFDSMDYYQKKFYASSLGLTDVNDLALILSGNMEDVAGATQKSSQEIEEAADRARELASFQDKLNAAFQQMIPILTPLIDGLGSIATWLTKNMDIIKPFLAVLMLIGAYFLGPVAAGIALATLGFSMLFDSVEAGEEKMSGLAIVLKPIIATVSALAKLIWFIVEPIVVLASNIYKWLEATGYLETAIHGFMVVGLALLVNFFWPAIAAFLAAKGAMILIGLAVTAVTAAFSKLARVVFKESFASTFLEGLVKLAYAFGEIAVRVIEVANPINQIRLLIEALGNAIGTVLVGITGFFTALTSKDAADNIMKIGEAITKIPIRKNLEFAASMGAAATAATASKAIGAVASAPPAPAAAGGGGGGGPIQVTLQLDAAATKSLLAGNVIKVMGGWARDALYGTG